MKQMLKDKSFQSALCAICAAALPAMVVCEAVDATPMWGAGTWAQVAVYTVTMLWLWAWVHASNRLLAAHYSDRIRHIVDMGTPRTECPLTHYLLLENTIMFLDERNSDLADRLRDYADECWYALLPEERDALNRRGDAR